LLDGLTRDEEEDLLPMTAAAAIRRSGKCRRGYYARGSIGVRTLDYFFNHTLDGDYGEPNHASRLFISGSYGKLQVKLED
jgi:hypothetical protein